MISKIEIIDNTKGPRRYIQDLGNFKNGTKYEFKPGVNIIVGKNGSGKSTLLDITAEYTLCSRTIQSRFPVNNPLELSRLFDDGFRDGIKVYHDYIGKVYRYLPLPELRKLGDKIFLESRDNISLLVSKGSTGENMMDGLFLLFDRLFNNDPKEFPLKEILEIIKTANDPWKNRFRSLLDYYKTCRIKVDNPEFTVLLDEPDRNLDIDNLEQIYNVLSYHKEMVQLIAVIHNPVLIYRLSQVEDINFIEMSPGYIEKIKKFVEN